MENPDLNPTVLREIQNILMEKWDPIGIADEPNAANEYDFYIGQIFCLLTERASKEQIISYLASVETECMGLSDLKGNPLQPDEYRIRTAEALQTVVV